MESLDLEDFINYKFLSDIKFSIDRQFSSFIVHHMDLDKNKYISNLYLLNNIDYSIEKLSSYGKEKSFIWKDKDTILFTNVDDKRELTNFYEINIHKKKEKKIFEIPLIIRDLKYIDNNNLVLLGKYKSNISYDKEDYQVIDEIPFLSDESGFVNKIRNRLYIYNISTNTLKPITDEFTNVNNFEINSDKSMIVLTTNSFIDKKSPKNQLQIYNILNEKLIKLSPINDFHYIYSNFFHDKICFIGSNMKKYGLNENPKFYITNYNGEEVAQISPDSFDFNVGSSINSDCRYGKSNNIVVDKEYIYFVTTEGDSSFINRIDIKGNIEQLTSKKGSIDSFHVSNGSINFIGMRSLKLQEVYSLENKKEIQISEFNTWVMEERTLSIPEKLTFKTNNGNLIEGWVMKPIKFLRGEKYPAILNIHGGPKTAYGEVFFHEMQFWANQGYVVFFCNPRGSDGRGNAFADIRGRYGTIDYEDIMDFTDLVLEKYPFIDKERLGVTGGSYGGFMTNWIIGRTNRFKAAVSQRCISNWISKFNSSDIGYYFVPDQINSTPWDNYTNLWDSSPLKYADNIITPTLFIHSDKDYRCPLAEGIQMFNSLKYHGVESRLCIFKGENHELSRSGKPKNRIKRLEEITDWFNKYLNSSD